MIKSDDLKKKLNEYVILYGPLDKRTLEASRKVDEIIVKEMKEVNIQ